MKNIVDILITPT